MSDICVFGAVGVGAGREGSRGLWFKRCLGFGLLGVFIFQTFLLPLATRFAQGRGAQIPKAQVSAQALGATAASDVADAPPCRVPEGAFAGGQAETAGLVSAREVASSCAGASREFPSGTAADEDLEKSGTCGNAVPDGPLGQVAFNFGSRLNVSAAAVLGLAGGFLQGLCGVPLPAILFFTLATGIPKDSWRACIATIGSLTGPVGMYYFLAHKGGFDETQVPLYLASVLGNVIALPLGNAVSKHVDQNRFRKALMLLMFAGSLILITSGTGTTSLVVIVLATAMIPIGGALLPYFRKLWT
mmetsp:Transcript_124170/g.397151  ORF Transcript_124170/g.397151 Transcript_124170/m.397151 type:complete len:302 (-) Transcript_124170:163-1068(-)